MSTLSRENWQSLLRGLCSICSKTLIDDYEYYVDKLNATDE